MIKNIEKEVSRFTDAVFQQILEINSRFIVVVFLLVGMILVDFKATMILLFIFSMIYILLVFFVGKIFSRYGKLISSSYASRIKLTNESLNSIKILKIYKIENYFNKLFKQVNNVLYNILLKVQNDFCSS